MISIMNRSRRLRLECREHPYPKYMNSKCRNVFSIMTWKHSFKVIDLTQKNPLEGTEGTRLMRETASSTGRGRKGGSLGSGPDIPAFSLQVKWRLLRLQYLKQKKRLPTMVRRLRLRKIASLRERCSC